MNSKTTNDIIKSLSEKYGYSFSEIKFMLLRIFESADKTMESADISKWYFPVIRLAEFGKFYVKEWKKSKLYLKHITIKKMTENKLKYETAKNYNIIVQSEPDEFVENNEPFYFSVDKEAPVLKVGDRIELVYSGNKRSGGSHLLDMEILDGKHPFYKGAVDLAREGESGEPKARFLMYRKHMKFIRL